MAVSFFSGKKKAEHNGFIISDIIDDKDSFQLIINLGLEQVVFTVDEKMEEMRVNRRYNSVSKAFNSFTNIFSQDITQAYERHFG